VDLCNPRRVDYGPGLADNGVNINTGVAMKLYRMAAVAFWLSALAFMSGSNLVAPASAAEPLGQLVYRRQR
jgi:hypothetical protein